ncbi:MAG: ABC transporter permease, partial [Roseburia sp.]|nr:ABC transporter permease [Roseburia sp.]
DSFGCILITMLVFGFVCFFIAEMLLQKRFRVFKKKRVAEWAGFAVVSMVFLTLFKLDVFGIERYIPAEEDVAQAFVYMDYPVIIDEEQLPQLLKIHQQILSEEERYLENAKSEESYYYTTIRYYLKDQTAVERRYPLPVTEVYLSDADSPTAVILDWECEPENLKAQVLGMNYKSNEYYSGTIDLFSAEGERKTYYLDRDEIEQIVAAVERDVEDGNFAEFYTYSVENDVESYYNGISLEYRTTDEMFDNWDYYHNYFWYASRETAVDTKMIESTMSSGSYITFGPGCVNIIETLEELGITDDTWKLMSYEEYEAAMGYDK